MLGTIKSSRVGAPHGQLSYADGFWPDEVTDNNETFRWMSKAGVIAVAPSTEERFLELRVSCEFPDCSQTLTVHSGSSTPLPPGLSNISLAVPPGASRLNLVVDRVVPFEHRSSDTRELGICVRSANLHADPLRHRAIVQQLENSVLNTRELFEGKTILASSPRVLGIDLYGSCNVKPPCVYCEWDWNKKLEAGFVDVPFDEQTLSELGSIYDNSSTLVNCSIGEPFMMKNIDELLDSFANSGKALDMTSNGQILTDRNIQKLVGRDIDLYVSLDAASSDTYAKLRNNRFDLLVANLRRLVAAKGGSGRLPRLNLVFMPMKANHHELDDFISLSKDIGADRLVLRPLNYSDRLDMTWKRAGYEFDYRRELLPFEQLIWISGRARALCDQIGLALSDQLDFGGSFESQFKVQYDAGFRSVAPLAPEISTQAQPEPAQTAKEPEANPHISAPAGPNHTAPLCTEPWKSLYVLRRGVFPCCYGGKPLAPMDQAASVWNSPAVEGIRADLAKGRFPSYCLDSPACPIVRKHEQANALSGSDAVRLRARHMASSVHRGITKIRWAGQWSRIRLRRIVTEPSYVKAHILKRLGSVRRSE